MTRFTLLAVCIAGSVACSDDGDKGRDTLPDGAVNPGTDGGPNGNIDSGLDSGQVGRDATTVLPDGNVITEPTPDSGNPAGPDATTPLPCGGSCDDNVDCTIDRCVNDKCEHRVDNDVCAAGSACDLKAGCKPGKACSGNAECMDNDACTVNERCNVPTATCQHDVLDRDGDGYPPVVCGGTDCDDARGTVNPSATETCNDRDDDCDDTKDDNLTPVTGYVCNGGQVGCAEGYQRCGGPNGACINLKTNHDSCGSCGNICDSGETCEAGECKCSASGTMCGMGMNAVCSDITKSQQNCGGCNMPCQLFGQGGQLQTCIASACTACGGEGQPCCQDINGAGGFGLSGCEMGLSCNGTKGTATSKCECGAGSTKCGDDCVDLKSNNDHCGACGTACDPDETCVTKGTTSACEPCGGAGEACCGGLVCFGGRVCGPDDTCVMNNASGPGGG